MTTPALNDVVINVTITDSIDLQVSAAALNVSVTDTPFTVFAAPGQTGPPGVNNLWTGSQADYDALPTKNPAVVYVTTP